MSKTFENAQVIIPLHDLESIIGGLIEEKLNAKYKKELEEKFLSPKETCNMFQPELSLPTVASYVEKGLLTKYYFGGKTWFRYSEVVEAVQRIKRYSRDNTVLS